MNFYFSTPLEYFVVKYGFYSMLLIDNSDERLWLTNGKNIPSIG